MPGADAKQGGLGLPTVTFIAVGFTVGAGIFVLSGVAGARVGGHLPLAYALAGVPVFLAMLPLAALGAARPTLGGSYRYPSRLLSPGLAFVGVWVYVLASFLGQVPLYALSAGRYLQAFWPGLSPLPFALGLLTFFYAVNLLGLRLATIIEGLMVLVLLAALLFFSGASLLHPVSLPQPEVAVAAGDLAFGAAVLTFTFLGWNGVLELGAEIRDPARTLPRSLFLAFPIVLGIYLLVSVAAVHAAPPGVWTSEGEPLLTIARLVLGPAGLAFFVVGGALLGLFTTLHALFLVGTRTLRALCEDQLLPESWGALHPRLGTPARLLTGIWILSLGGVASGLSLPTLATYAALGGMILLGPLLLCAFLFPRRFPKEVAACGFALSPWLRWTCCGLGGLMVLFFCAVLLGELVGGSAGLLKLGLFVGFLVSGAAVYGLRARSLRARGLDPLRLLQPK